jgi:hypothetical protein
LWILRRRPCVRISRPDGGNSRYGELGRWSHQGAGCGPPRRVRSPGSASITSCEAQIRAIQSIWLAVIARSFAAGGDSKRQSTDRGPVMRSRSSVSPSAPLRRPLAVGVVGIIVSAAMVLVAAPAVAFGAPDHSSVRTRLSWRSVQPFHRMVMSIPMAWRWSAGAREQRWPVMSW